MTEEEALTSVVVLKNRVAVSPVCSSGSLLAASLSRIIAAKQLSGNMNGVQSGTVIPSWTAPIKISNLNSF
jgi:hypothetical protein